MATRRASCSCGQLAVEVEADPVRVSICHCLACQRRTGSVFAMQARWRREHVRIKGDATEYVRTSDEGEDRSFFFCPPCGATVYYWPDSEHLAVPVGAFADPNFPAPRISVWPSLVVSPGSSPVDVRVRTTRSSWCGRPSANTEWERERRAAPRNRVRADGAPMLSGRRRSQCARSADADVVVLVLGGAWHARREGPSGYLPWCRCAPKQSGRNRIVSGSRGPMSGAFKVHVQTSEDARVHPRRRDATVPFLSGGLPGPRRNK
jgi:hypothetical protein